MDTAALARLRINDRVRIAAPVNSYGARHNGEEGQVTGFVRNWFVVVRIKGEGYRFYPTDLMPCSRPA